MTKTLPLALLLLTAGFATPSLRAQEPAQAPIEVEELPPPGGAAPAQAEAADPNAEAAPEEPVTAEAVDDPLKTLETDAESAYADGDLAHALTLYQDLGERHPDPAERARVRILAAWLSWQLKDSQGAQTQLEAALFDYPKPNFRAELYSSEFAAAFQDAQAAALARRRRVAAETINRASASLQSGRLAEARHLLVEALALTPDDPDALYNLAQVDLREGKQDDALTGFERVLALERGNPEGVPPALKSQSLNNSAVIYFARGEFADAERALSEAVALTPEDAKAWLNLGLTRQKLGHSDDSYEALHRARELAPTDPAVARALAIAEVQRSNWVAAVALLVEATQAQPEDAELRLQLGRAQNGLGNKAGAVDSFKKAIDLDPDGKAGVTQVALQMLIDLLLAQGDTLGAAAAAERAVALEPQSGAAWLRLGLARYQKGELVSALEALKKADSLAPGRADVAHNLGVVQMALKDYPGAELSLRAAAERDPSNAETKAALDRLDHALKEIAKAELARGELGATLAVAEYAALKIKGLRVDDVPLHSVAERIGLQKNDLILRVDGKSVETLEQLFKRLVGKKKPPVIDALRSGAPVQVVFRID